MAAIMDRNRLLALLASSPCKYVWLDGDGALVLGRDIATPSEVVDFATETLETAPRTRTAAASPMPRRSGHYRATVLEESAEFGRLADLLKWVLLKIEDARPSMLTQLEQVVPRTKRIVARDKRALFKQKSDMFIDKHAERLNDRFWFGTNNSEDEVRRWVVRACEIAGLRPGADVLLELG